MLLQTFSFCTFHSSKFFVHSSKLDLAVVVSASSWLILFNRASLSSSIYKCFKHRNINKFNSSI